jgi:hypothetical protein
MLLCAASVRQVFATSLSVALVVLRTIPNSRAPNLAVKKKRSSGKCACLPLIFFKPGSCAHVSILILLIFDAQVYWVRKRLVSVHCVSRRSILM